MARAGLGNGLVLGLATHWLFWEPLAERAYGIAIPAAVRGLLWVVATLALLAAALTIGVRAVRLARERVRTAAAALSVGGAAGLLAGSCVYLIVAVVGAWLVLGGAPLVSAVAEAGDLSRAAAREALLQAARDAAPAPWLVLGACLALGGLIGSFEGLVYTLFLRRQGPGCKGAEGLAPDEAFTRTGEQESRTKGGLAERLPAGSITPKSKKADHRKEKDK